MPGPDTLFTVSTMLPKNVIVLPPATHAQSAHQQVQRLAPQGTTEVLRHMIQHT